MPLYVVRRLTGEFEELSCFRQIEDEGAALYFNIVHGTKVHRHFTTKSRASAARTMCLSPKCSAATEASGKEKLHYSTRRAGADKAGTSLDFRAHARRILAWLDGQITRSLSSPVQKNFSLDGPVAGQLLICPSC
jgi:hypothetical protein